MTTQPTAAQALLMDTARIKTDIELILAIARTVAEPMPGEQASFLDIVTKLLERVIAGMEETQKSVMALHHRLEQPGIADVLQRVMDGN